MALPYASLLVAGLGGLSFHLLAIAAYRAFFGPLKDLPGPWYTKISDFWLTLNELVLRQPLYIDGLFAQYGPIVRLGPKTVAFLDASAAKSVYKFPKDAWYRAGQINRQDVSFSMADPAEHGLRRRGFAAHYTAEHMLRYQQDFQDLALLLVSHLVELGGRESANCLAMFQHFAVDVLGITAYDTQIDATKQWCEGRTHEATTAIHELPAWMLLTTIIPGWIWSLMHFLPGRKLQGFLNADVIVRSFAEGSLNRMRQALDEGKRDPQDQSQLVARLLQYKMPGGKSLGHEELVAEIEFHTAAAVDTTSNTASYGFWALAKYPDVLRTLQAELDDAMPEGQRIPDLSTLATLPYLNAVIKEVLRLYTACPSSLPRTVPSKGPAVEIHGYSLPPGTTVTTQAYSAHRQGAVFDDPTTFRPERWLDDTDAMRANYFPFGQGTRVCSGQSLAMMLLRITFAALVRNLDPVLPPQTTDKSMGMLFAFSMFAWSGKCDIIFVPRKESQ
ncbi:cytochrome P450 [Auriculariales sp. MPI-PUGE-AT-0066]|nr:cytochrome P450 [Auriculariales sp. MPI-PUGE-AT-0066]